MLISILRLARRLRLGRHSLEQVFDPVEMTMLLLRFLGTWLRTLTLALGVCFLPSGCTGSSPDSCPSYLVRLDASALGSDGGLPLDSGVDGGVDGFTFVGEWRNYPFCTRYCAGDYFLCQLVNETTVSCYRGCQ